MKLFCAPGPLSLLPHILLREMGLPFTAIKINEHTKVIEGGGDYREVNPLGYVPALVLDDGTLLKGRPSSNTCGSGAVQKPRTTERHIQADETAGLVEFFLE
jgi:hypothetical protein